MSNNSLRSRVLNAEVLLNQRYRRIKNSSAAKPIYSIESSFIFSKKPRLMVLHLTPHYKSKNARNSHNQYQ